MIVKCTYLSCQWVIIIIEIGGLVGGCVGLVCFGWVEGGKAC